MKQEDYIAIEDFCNSHNVTSQFIMQLNNMGLVEIVYEQELRYLPIKQLPDTERIVRLYLDLDINLEGIEVIIHLLDRMQHMRTELISLQNKLNRYE